MAASCPRHSQQPGLHSSFLSKIITKTGELLRPPTTHPEETEEELTEQQEPLSQGSFVVDGSTESEETQDDLQEEKEEEEEAVEEPGCPRVKDEAGESELEEEQEVEELGVTYRQVRPALKSFNQLNLCAGHLFLCRGAAGQGRYSCKSHPLVY